LLRRQVVYNRARNVYFVQVTCNGALTFQSLRNWSWAFGRVETWVTDFCGKKHFFIKQLSWHWNMLFQCFC